MAKVFQDGFLRQRDAYHLLVPQRPLDDLFGRRMLEALMAAGVDVRLSTTISAMAWQGAYCKELRLSNDKIICPDLLIVAVPWHAVGSVVGSCLIARCNK